MIPHQEVIFPRNILLERLDALIFEFNDFPAGRTDQVIVMIAGWRVFISRNPVVKTALISQSRDGKQFHGPVYRCIADSGLLFLDLKIEILRAHMPAGVDKNAQNTISLGRGAQPLTGKIG